ncbi:hypothetical protein BV898_19406 [Hypsibius exemplaris]|uniref:Uncharacterized protein n=1 Tax=Hypsibius exemplaris TaxID=2072580 RepID=A0A9X6NLL0_HYPEX|nr:hypothetical protein BV898_19406 [Hypsibius exemplaris]
MDVRVVYLDAASTWMGFTLELEFKENPFFSDNILKRSYRFEKLDELDYNDEMDYSFGLRPFTYGCDTAIKWKLGKETSQKTTVRNMVSSRFWRSYLR